MSSSSPRHALSFCIFHLHKVSFCILNLHRVLFCIFKLHNVSLRVFNLHKVSFCILNLPEVSFCIFNLHIMSFCRCTKRPTWPRSKDAESTGRGKARELQASEPTIRASALESFATRAILIIPVSYTHLTLPTIRMV